MKFPAFLTLAGSVLVLGSGNLLHAQQSTLKSPAARDLNQPSNNPAAPAPARAEPLVELKIATQFDANGDHQLDATERQAARTFLAQHPPPEPTPPPGRPGQPALPTVALEPAKSGGKVNPTAVSTYPGRPLYDPKIVRTYFLEIPDADWEKELADFARTDVLVPARLTIDGQALDGIGVHFRALAATTLQGPGYKRPIDLTLNPTVSSQLFGGQRQIHLLAASSDPTFLRSMLYYRVAREYIPTPQACFVRLIINGEDWGIYVNAQPFDENFIRDNFRSTKGARWMVLPGGTFAYLGDNPEAYRKYYRLESAEDPAAWAALIKLCQALSQKISDEPEIWLDPLLDVEDALKFLALENAFINQDGYGSRTGNFGLELDQTGRFHLVPQDAEASFRLIQVSEYGSRGRGGAGSGGGGRRGGSGNRNTAAEGGQKTKETAKAKPAAITRDNFPKQSGTNLAMLLSYSLVNKADSDFDEEVTRGEWLDFARVWFSVMDEDLVGRLTRDQFITKVRLLVTPPSIIDGRTRQTFGREDPAGQIGQDFFTAMDENRDGLLTPDELTGAFARWFAAWSNPKTARLTQDELQTGLTGLLTQTVFEADQTYIATKAIPQPEEEERGGGGRGGGGRGGRGGGGVGNGVSVGPLHMGLGGRGGGNGNDSRSLVTFGEQLDSLEGRYDTDRPLLDRLLAAPALRSRYLDDLRDISEKWLDWKQLGPVAQEYHDLIAAEVAKDTHKAASYEHFVQDFDQVMAADSGGDEATPSLKAFAAQRRAYLQKDDSPQ